MGNIAEAPVFSVSVCSDVLLWFEPVCSLLTLSLHMIRRLLHHKPGRTLIFHQTVHLFYKEELN